jgi:hypothetical protein
MPNFPQIDKAAKWDTYIQQGSTFMRSFSFANFDISEYQFRGTIRKSYTDRRALATYKITKESSTEFFVELNPNESRKLKPGFVFHDIEIYYTENDVDIFVARILEGKIKVTPEVTR